MNIENQCEKLIINELCKMGVEGWQKPVYVSNEIVGFVTEYSDYALDRLTSLKNGLELDSYPFWVESWQDALLEEQQNGVVDREYKITSDGVEYLTDTLN